MKAYADTGLLVSLFAADSNTAAALKRMKTQALPLPWTWLHELEFKNAIRLKVFRKEINDREANLVMLKLDAVFDSGTFLHTALPADVTKQTERLSVMHTPQLGTRSLDILHVAHAATLGLPEFLTFDKRQAALAKAAGLKVPQL